MARQSIDHSLEPGGGVGPGFGPDGEVAAVVDLFEGAGVLVPVEDAAAGEGAGEAGAGGVVGVGVGDPVAEVARGGDRVEAAADQGLGVDARGQAVFVEVVEQGAQGQAGLGAAFDGESGAAVVGTPGELAEGAREDGGAVGVGLGGDGSDAGEDERGAEFVGEGASSFGPAEPLVELVEGVEGAAGGQVQADQGQLDRAEGVAELAAAGLREPVGGQVARGFDDDAAGSEPGGLAELLLDGPGGVEPETDRGSDHARVAFGGRVDWRRPDVQVQ